MNRACTPKDEPAMSYILDALRRADSERDRGAVPGVHAQPVPMHWRIPRGKRPMRAWLGALIGLSVVVLGAFAWHLAGRETPPNVAPTAALPALPPSPGAAPTAAPAAAPAAPPATPPGPAPTATATANPAPPATPSPAPPPAVAARPSPAAAPPVAKAPERPRVAATPSAEPGRRKAPAAPATEPPTFAEGPSLRAATKSDPAAATKSDPAAAPAATPESRVYAQHELPQDVRRQLPQLSFGGSMYSENPASRMLIVNGQLVHEGATLAPGLSLEQIKLRSAIFRFKGYRYEISY
jgi:general secretion pathway protein B